MRKRRLKSLTDLRRYLADALNRFERSEIDETRLKTIAYSINILSSLVKDSDLESRVEALEKLQAERPGGFRHAN